MRTERSRRKSGRESSSSSGSAAGWTMCVASASLSVTRPWCRFTISFSLPAAPRNNIGQVVVWVSSSISVLPGFIAFFTGRRSVRTDEALVDVGVDAHDRLDEAFGLDQSLFDGRHHFNVAVHARRRRQVQPPPAVLGSEPVFYSFVHCFSFSAINFYFSQNFDSLLFFLESSQIAVNHKLSNILYKFTDNREKIPQIFHLDRMFCKLLTSQGRTSRILKSLCFHVANISNL